MAVMSLNDFKELEGAMTARESAVELNAIWQKVKPQHRGKTPFRAWADKYVGNGRRREAAHQLLHRGPWVTLLWRAVEEDGLSIYEAVSIARKAEKEDGNKEENMRKLLREYYRQVEVCSGKSGMKMRRKAKPKPKVRQNTPVDVSYVTSSGKELWAALLEMGTEYADARLGDIDEDEKKRSVDTFLLGLRVVYEDFKRDIDRMQVRKRQGLLNNGRRTSTRSLRMACDVLGIPMPHEGTQMDMAYAARRYKTLAARFHPDKHEGSEKTLKQYHAVNEAWKIIKEARDGHNHP